MPALRFLTLPRLISALILIAVIAIAFRAPLDTDTYWHLRAGQWMVENRTLLSIDQFSSTRLGAPWINIHWLTQLVLYGMHSLAGDVGLAMFTTLLAVAGMAFLFPLLKGDPILRAFVMVLGAGAAALFWTPRPQMMSFLFSAVTLNLIWRYVKDGKDRLWVLIPIMILWANMHPGFAIAFILLALSIAGLLVGWLVDKLSGVDTASNQPLIQSRRLLIVAVASAAAILINPFGLDTLLHPFRTVGIGVLRDFIQEWASPNFHGRETWPFLLLLVSTFGLAALSSRPLRFFDVALLTGTAASALLAGRNIPVFMIAAVPILSEHLDAFMADHNLRLNTERLSLSGPMLAINWLLLVVALAGGLLKMASEFVPARLSESRATIFPVKAVEYMQSSDAPRQLFNSYNWGGYLTWYARDYPVFVDGRTDLYDDELLRNFLRVYYAQPGWDQQLDEHGVNTVLVESSSPLAAVLRLTPGWSQTYADDVAVVFERDNPIIP